MSSNVRFRPARFALLAFAAGFALAAAPAAQEKQFAPGVDLVVAPRLVPPRPPVIVLPPTPAGPEKPVDITRALVEVSVHGAVARTAVTLTFHNPNARVLEGELVFPLPEGATVAGYGLDVNGEMVDATPVPRVQARRIFEEEVRRNPTIDPGLVEAVQGNVFRSRVHPLPARGNRQVKVAWLAPLEMRDGAGFVPLSWGLTVPEVEVRLRVATDAAKDAGANAAKEGGDGRAVFGAGDFAWTATKTLKDYTLDGGVRCQLPGGGLPVGLLSNAGTPAVEDVRDDDGLTAGHYFAVAVAPDHSRIPAFDGPVPAPKPWTRLGIAWDASLSRLAPEARAREIALIGELLAARGAGDGVAIDLVVFRDGPDKAISLAKAPPAEQAAALRKALDAVPYDGATDYSALDLPAQAADGEKYDAWWLFTDGLATLNDARPVLGAKAHVFSFADKADHALLAYFARQTGGHFFNLDSQDDKDVANALAFDIPPLHIARLHVDGQVADVQPAVGEPLDALRGLVTGRLLSDEATLTVTLAGGPLVHAPEQTFAVKLSKRGAAVVDAGAALAGALWAQRRIAELSPLGAARADELERLGRDFRLVTPNTSLLVLENLDQFLRHDIRPPRSRKTLRAQFDAQRAKQAVDTQNRAADRLRAVQAMWEEKTRWYDTEFSAGAFPPAPLAKGTTISAPAAPSSGIVVREDAEARAEGPGATVDALPASPAPRERGQSHALRANLRPSERAADAAAAVPMVMAAPAALGDLRGGFAVAGRRLAAAGDAAGEAFGADASAGGGVVAVQGWVPQNAPYVAILREAPADRLYDAYLLARPGFLRAPGFFLDCATLFAERGRADLALRALGNVLELDLGVVALQRAVAHRYQQLGRADRAAALFRRILRERPDEPQSRRDLALALVDVAGVDRTDDTARALRRKAVDLLHHVVMNGPYGRFDRIETIALTEANRLAARMPADPAFKNPFDESLRRNLDSDVRVLLTWDADDTDIDLWVVEPSGEQCGYNHALTKIGGRLSRDFTQGYGPEEYSLRRRASGTYRVRANYYGSRQQRLQGPVTVQATIFLNWGRPDETRETLTVRLADNKEWVDLGRIELAVPAAR